MNKQLKPLAALMCLLGCTTLPAYAASSSTYTATHTSATTPHDITSVAPPITGQEIVEAISKSKEHMPFDLDVPGHAFVSSGPYVGVPVQFNGYNLVVNSLSVNTDLQLLTLRKSINERFATIDEGLLQQKPYHSHLVLSGVLEAQADYYDHSGPRNGGNPISNIDVTNVSLDALFLGPSNWTLGFVELTYDNATPAGSPYLSNSNYTVINSRVYVNKAFITIGNLEVSPFYGSIGQLYVPFGTYMSTMVSDPMTKTIGRTKARALVLGANPQCDNTPYGEIYVFRGDSHIGEESKINNGGVNLAYKFKMDDISGHIGVGAIGNIADSVGMQEGTGFQDDEDLRHRVPAYNVHGLLNLGEHVTLIGEYVGASTHFDPDDASFNNHGAKPSAYELEAAYSFAAWWNRPSAIALGYGKSEQGLALGIPLSRTSVVLNTSIWRNTIQSLEFRHDREYAASDTANGPDGSPALCTAANCTQTGQNDNAITAQFDYYF